MSAVGILQTIAWDWGVRCFGEAHMHDRKVRALRMVEEAIEAAQACGVEEHTIHSQVGNVYMRPHGDLKQELGGLLLTTSVMCTTHKLNMEDTFAAEVIRCLRKTPEWFAERNRQKIWGDR